ncbi:cation/H(+) antiporter 15-like [Tripterygium wilfordii]|uniref:Cation/H(+) antiporter 15-like n=2 Tax=Tripterygium wilfordii TaxID=458696 RepID=A0A7J7CWP2_TRIWF|nr:cation/H(+) antiporter 15-like [Tripterygium wilfordii]
MGIRDTRKLAETIMVIGNRTIVCQDKGSMWSLSLWHSSNPLQAAIPLLLVQVSLISTVSKLIEFCLKPLGQSTIVSQILGGMVFGPSMLGHQKTIASTLFPLRGTLVIETFATFGIIFFIFSVGVKMEPVTLLRSQPQALVLGLSVFFFTLILPVALATILRNNVPMQTSFADSITLIAGMQSFTSLPVVACLLNELKLINTEIGRLALCASIYCDILGILVSAVVLSITQTKSNNSYPSYLPLLSVIVLTLVIIFIVRPLILRFIHQLPIEKPINEAYIVNFFVLVLVATFVSEFIGQHFVFGPLVLGMIVPDGPPLGTSLTMKIDTFVSGLLYPTYLAVSGLNTNVFLIKFESVWIVGSIIVFSFFVKLGSAMVPATFFCNLPAREALTLGLILNARGIIDIMTFNVLKQGKMLGDEEFSLAVISVIFISATIMPLIKLLYNPWHQYHKIRQNTIQHAKYNSDFRILVCIHHHDNIPTIINLLEVSHASEESHVITIALVLVELAGRTTPLLVSHRAQTRTFESTSSTTGQIVNALRRYEQYNQGCAMVESFTSISSYATMHGDICRLALDKRANIVIMPFHKQWAIDGSVGSIHRPIQNLNINVLNKAPCTVGILIDRGIVTGSTSVIASKRVFNVGVLFFGGADDAEALAYAARMVNHECVRLLVTRYILFGSENSRERKRDTETIDEYLKANAGNERFKYEEQVLRDGVGVAQSIKAMSDCYDLMLVGKYHPESPLFTGLDEWSECLELGIIGDLLASSDFESKASVIVVQQQRLGGPLINRTSQQAAVNDRSERPAKKSQVHDVSFEDNSVKAAHQKPMHHSDDSWSIAINAKNRL